MLQALCFLHHWQHWRVGAVPVVASKRRLVDAWPQGNKEKVKLEMAANVERPEIWFASSVSLLLSRVQWAVRACDADVG